MFKGLRQPSNVVVVVTLFLVAMVSTAAPVMGAQHPDPHSIVSSDGGSFTATEADISVQGVSGSPGTGTPSAHMETFEPPSVFRGLLALPPATGKVGIETIIPPDTRALVTPTTGFPARAIVLITFTGGRCTGFMIGANTVATAGHCVHTGGPGGSFRPLASFRVYPGRNGATSPFGSCTARRLFTVSGWVTSSSELTDYGAIKLNCTVGTRVGFFGFWWQSATLTGTIERVDGYPGDKPLTQWRSSGVIAVTQTRQVFYKNDTTGGMSGSPVYSVRAAGSPFCVGRCAMAIHAYGLHGLSPHSTNNHGTRIVQAVFNNLVTWRNAL
jgi:glutamyl endopeptidase